MYNGVKQILNL